eukprot:226501-Pyramimonas_sp.AAC.1
MRHSEKGYPRLGGCSDVQKIAVAGSEDSCVRNENPKTVAHDDWTDNKSEQKKPRVYVDVWHSAGNAPFAQRPPDGPVTTSGPLAQDPLRRRRMLMGGQGEAEHEAERPGMMTPPPSPFTNIRTHIHKHNHTYTHTHAQLHLGRARP